MSIDPGVQSDRLDRLPGRSYEGCSDMDLAVALCCRDGVALEEAFRRHVTLVATTALRLSRPSYVDDIVQMVFQALWRTPERFHPERGSLGCYLKMLTKQKTIDVMRSDEHRYDRETRFQPGPCDNVEALAIAGVTAAELQVALCALPMQERVPIELAYFGGDTYRVVAIKLGQPEGTVKSRIRTGLRRLEALLQPMGAAECG